MNLTGRSKGSSATISLDQHEAKLAEVTEQLQSENAESVSALTAEKDSALAQVAELTEAKAQLESVIAEQKAELATFEERVEAEAVKKTAEALVEHGSEPLNMKDAESKVVVKTASEVVSMSATDRAEFLKLKNQGKAKVIENGS